MSPGIRGAAFGGVLGVLLATAIGVGVGFAVPAASDWAVMVVAVLGMALGGGGVLIGYIVT